jgi:hypothetical protein
MIFFAAFTLGYFAGVFTFLLAFPPRTKEIEEQEVDALKPLLELEEEKSEKEYSPSVILDF